MIIEKNSIDVPEHLNETFFQEITEKVLKTCKIEVIKVSFKMASTHGDNYTSRIYQVHVTYKKPDSAEQSTSIIIKSMPPARSTENIDLLDVYKRETTAYFKAHQLVKDLLPDAKFAPQCYHAFREPFQTFILEDLKAQNFRTLPKEHGLDEVHARMFLEKLGKYHAATMMFCEKDPDIRNEYKDGQFTSQLLDTLLMQEYFNNSFQEAVSLVEKWPGYESIVKKLRRISDNFKQTFLDAVDSTNDTIKVLNHGDLWTTNIMFQYDSEESSDPKEVLFIDFQIGHIASPGIDLNFFFNTSLHLEVLKSKREELIGHYYNSFSETLSRLGYKNIPSERAVRNEIHRKELFGLIILCTLAPFVYCDPKHITEDCIEASYDESELERLRKVMFTAPIVFDILQYGLKRLDELQVLDIPYQKKVDLKEGVK